jgi:2,5-diamino-6-(ribosylamino)-4(3H)-pyrimidinone 5'-phosphate reductase
VHPRNSSPSIWIYLRKIFYLITTNKKHPAYSLLKEYDNVRILQYEKEIDFVDVFSRFKHEFGIKRVTIQTGGTLNATLLRFGLIDHISLVIAPCLIGGSKTQSLIGGESLQSFSDLEKIKALKLTKIEKLERSYLHLKYDVINI